MKLDLPLKYICLPFIFILLAYISSAQMPTISSFSPASGPVGTLVTITGTNLLAPNSFTIGGTPAITISNNGTSLVGLVMPGANTGTVVITTSGGTATSSSSFSITPTGHPATQQGNKLVGTGNSGSSIQGSSVAISADGNTAIIGGQADNSSIGAAWVFTRSGGTWNQQGTKLVGTGYTGTNISQGSSVGISADGNTAIVGGNGDNNGIGAAWVFSRTGNTWTQQGSKLVGTGYIGSTISQGTSVALSADGSTAILGGFADNNYVGASWIFARSGSTWSQQGSKLVGTGYTGTNIYQGYSVAMSADGNTAAAGAYLDGSSLGAVWVFTRNGNTWSQQGSKLVCTGNTGSPVYMGYAIALSADGNTAIAGGYFDNVSQATGAAWVFTRSGGNWSQQGNKLVGSGFTVSSEQGHSVGLSADGNTAVIGGYGDDSHTGAIWVFTRNGSNWSQQGGKLVGTGSSGSPSLGWSLALSADGNTALAGGETDNGSIGAAWVFVPATTGVLSTTRGIDGLSVLPVPSNGDLAITCTNTSMNGQLACFLNMQGSVVYQFTLRDKQHINISTWPAGVYFLHLSNGAAMKIVKD